MGADAKRNPNFPTITYVVAINKDFNIHLDEVKDCLESIIYVNLYGTASLFLLLWDKMRNDSIFRIGGDGYEKKSLF